MSARTPARWARGTVRTRDGARFVPASCNAKLARLNITPANERDRRSPLPPFISSTDVSIGKTCGRDCPFKNSGCWAQDGFTRFTVEELDDAAIGIKPLTVIDNLVMLIDGAFGGGCVPQDGKFGGRDLRLMNFGDFFNTAGARRVAGAAARWVERGGGRVFGFTHLWRSIWPEAFGSISVLASVETGAAAEKAHKRGYVPAIVVDKFPNGHRAFPLPGTTIEFIPCPGETETATRKKLACVDCRLCMDAGALYARNKGIAFEVHGHGEKRAREQLVQLRRREAAS